MFSLGTFAASFFVTLLYLVEHNWRLPIQVLAGVMIVLSCYAFIAARSQAKVLKGQPKAPKKTLAFGVIIKQPVLFLWRYLRLGMVR